jgi:predicted secreted hydrolase
VRGVGRRALLAAALVALAGSGALAAGAPPAVRLPRDHFAHPRAGVEWWYVTALVRARDGRRYTVFFTLFRGGRLVAPVSQVVDLERDRIVGHTERLGAATPTPTRLDVHAAGATLAYAPETGTWTFGAIGAGYSLSLSARPEKPYILHGGGTGRIRQGPHAQSAYYSATRMAAEGAFTTGGRRVAFTGLAWLDHQWGDFAKDPQALDWDWFSCRFTDRSELMLYRFRNASVGAGTYVRADGSAVEVPTFTAAAGAGFLRAAGHTWPLDWRVRVPSLGLDLRLRSLARNQLFRGKLVPTFWEGAAAASGSKRGDCFVEVTYR